MQMAQPSLSDLCSICYTEIPKYRCPRCKTQTCSLPCYKRHQQRASCSGKRDPAAYLKKSQLATPSSIDRDYNYLKGVEKNIEGATVDAAQRGYGSLLRDSQGRGPKREGAFRRYLAANGIAVEWAPKGLSRQKTNQSRVTKNDQVFWTVEWRDGSGEQDLRHNAPESSTLSELYRGVQTAKRKRKLASQSSGESTGATSKKRKASEDAISLSSVPPLNSTPGQETQATKQDDEPQADDLSLGGETLKQRPSTATHQEHEHHFYLSKPSTGNHLKVVVPLDCGATLTKALEGQTVQEYPTIYVLHEPQDRLPDGFVRENQRRSTTSRDVKTAEPSGRSVGQHRSQSGPKPAEDASGGGELDANAILKMLRRDVKA